MYKQYDTFKIDLRTAGEYLIDQMLGYLVFNNAETSNGAEVSDAVVEVSFGNTVDDWVKCYIGAAFILPLGEKPKKIKIRWAAQPHIRWARFFISEGPEQIKLEVPNRATILTETLNVISGDATFDDAYLLSTTASKILSEDTTRATVTLQNNDTVDIWVGASTVHIANKIGCKISAGGSFTFAGQGELYAVAESGAPKLSAIGSKM
ncbi:MAG: hypothetical protein KAJ75_04810 [Alphaproteobacteria bacterium]|nr:hypothetical protein [Alphaproteobacteria bacterium]